MSTTQYKFKFNKQELKQLFLIVKGKELDKEATELLAAKLFNYIHYINFMEDNTK